MSLVFHIQQQQGLVEIEGNGAASFDSLLALMEQLLSHPDFKTHFAILVNFSEVSYVPSFWEIRKFGGVFQKLRQSFLGKVAFWVSSPAQIKAGRFASVIARTIHFQMQVFGDQQSAMNWLFGQKEFKMDQLKTKILDVLRTFQLSAVATVHKDGIPWVRYVITSADENMVIRFATPLHSRKVAQLIANPNVHVTCGVSEVATAKQWVQVGGVASVKTDVATKKDFWNDFLRAYFDGPDDPQYAVVEIVPSRIEYYTMESIEPEVLEL